MGRYWHDSILTIAMGYLNKFARDMYLPALPALAVIFSTTDQNIQYSVSIFFAAMFLGRLFWPVIKEKYALMVVTHWNIGVFCLATVLSLFWVSVEGFYVTRFLQGFTVCALPTLLRGFVFERHQAKATIKVLSFTSIVTVWSSSVAMLLGGYLLHWVGWQAIPVALFVTAALCWLMVGLSRPASIGRGADLALLQTLKEAVRCCGQSQFLQYSLPFSLISGGLAGYLTMAPFLFMDELGLTVTQLGHISLVIFSGMMVGKLLAGWLSSHWSTQQLTLLGMLLCVLAAGLLWMPYDQLVLAVGGMSLFMVGYGVLVPVCKTAVMAVGNGFHYTATAMIGVLAGLFSAVVSATVAYFAFITLSVFAVLLSIMVLLALLVFCSILFIRTS